MSKQVCGNCIYCCEGIISDGKGTYVYSCLKIRGGKCDGFDFEQERMKVSKSRKACNFYKT